jgi:hypothetical protein
MEEAELSLTSARLSLTRRISSAWVRFAEQDEKRKFIGGAGRTENGYWSLDVTGRYGEGQGDRVAIEQGSRAV